MKKENETMITKKHGSRSDVPLCNGFEEYLLTPYLATLKAERTRVEYRRQILTVCSYFYHLRRHDYMFYELTREDAHAYFLVYLSGECRSGKCSYDTFRLRLSCCKNFAIYLEERLLELAKGGNTLFPAEYKSAFSDIIRPAAKSLVRTDRYITEDDIDKILSVAFDYDKQLFVIFLLSFRMMLTQSTILSLKKDQFSFVKDGNRTVGILSVLQKNKPEYKRIPADILPYVQQHVQSRTGGYVFLNSRGTQFSSCTFTNRMDKMEKDTGLRVKLGHLRMRGLVDMVAHNSDSFDEIENYTGLSKRMLKGYGEALERISDGCVADRTGYHILVKENRKED